MNRIVQTTIVSIAMLFCMQTAHAATKPIPFTTSGGNPGYKDIGILGVGTHNFDHFLSDDSEYAFWFEFELSLTADVSLNTAESVFYGPPYQGAPYTPLDTILALYNSGGVLQTDNSGNTENDSCGGSGALTSCQSFSSLAAGTYMAGVTVKSIEKLDGSGVSSVVFAALGFDDMWEVDYMGDIFDSEVFLNIDVAAPSAVPVPAAVWLFGSALIGFVGMSRRKSVKT